MEKPFIYLAFANQEGKKDNLKALNEEIQNLKIKLMRRAISEELNYALDENVEDGLLVDSFRELKLAVDRPKIIHFAGHADISTWRIKGDKRFEGQRIETILRGISNVKLVFMNACSTDTLKKYFLDELNVEAVISTDTSIDDAQATLFSTTFYDSLLIHGKTILDSFNEAAVKIGMSTELVKEGNSRGMVMKNKDEKHLSWGLSWRDKTVEQADFKILFSKDIPPEKRQLWIDYEQKVTELKQKAVGISTELESIELQRAQLTAAITDESIRTIALQALDRNKELIKEPLKKLEDEAEILRLKLINLSLPNYVQSRLDEFNFDKQMGGMNEACMDKINFKYRTGAYILRGTKECGLGFLIKKIASSFMLTPEDTIFKDDDKKPVVVDCGALSFQHNLLLKDLQKRFRLEKESISNINDLANAFVKNHFKLPYSSPFILIFDNLQIQEHLETVQLLINDFWVAMHKALKKEAISRPVLFLIVERRPVISEFDIPFNADDFTPKDADFINSNGLVHCADDVSKDVISVTSIKDWCTQKGFIFSAWVSRAELLLDANRPRVQPTLMKMAENFVPKSDDKTDDAYIKTQQYILEQDELKFYRIW